MAPAPKAKAGPLVVFRCPKDLDEEVLKIANINLLERTDIIILAAEHLLHVLKDHEIAFDLELQEDNIPQGEIDLSHFDEASMNEEEDIGEHIDGMLSDNKMPWD